MTAVENSSDIFSGTQAATTSYYGVGGDVSMVQHVQLSWDATFVGVFTFWTSDRNGVALNSTVAQDWCQENPPTGYTAVSPSGAATTVTPLVISVPGGTAGCASVQLGNSGAKRLRTRVVCTVAGFITISSHGKF